MFEQSRKYSSETVSSASKYETASEAVSQNDTEDSFHDCSDNQSQNDHALRKRLSIQLGKALRCGADMDKQFYGSAYVDAWLLTFTQGKGGIKFDAIFNELIAGIEVEGRIDPKDEKNMNKIVKTLNILKNETTQLKNKHRIKRLQQCCVTLYTQDTYVCRVVNTALREEDQSKLRTVGPFCYLLFNNISYHENHHSSISYRFRQLSQLFESEMTTLYRGDFISDELFEEYQKSIDQRTIYFKWRSFVSTSTSEQVARQFGDHNILYELQLDHHSAEDQCIKLTSLTQFSEENEILLRPGVRFRIIKIESHVCEFRHKITIEILPSYISSLYRAPF
ncbi:unnamed protein product [Adineta steineri]|uniref:ADP ribosyltransferase domain-containing protein n=1 Tax=Adineta steineri TaxID=433720 RepID=A0A813MVI8_9BILA|nr:unnamed protein product [Adineta steineri]CAF3989620.1 unnamed protein product [Adineta steineri]